MRYLLGLLRDTRPLDRLFFCGYVLYLVFCSLAVHSSTMLSAAGGSEHTTLILFWCAETAARFALLTALVCCARVVTKASVPAFTVITGVVAIAGFLITGMVLQLFGIPPTDRLLPWFLIGGVLLGMGEVLIILLWARFSANLRLRAVYLLALLSNLLSFAVFFLITLVPRGLGVLVGLLDADTLWQGDLLLAAVALSVAHLICTAALFLFKDRSFRGREDVPGAQAAQADPSLVHRCEDVAAQYQFTAREGEILMLLAQGYTVVVVSEKLFVSENTVKSHVKSIYHKLNIHSRSDLIKLVNAG